MPRGTVRSPFFVDGELRTNIASLGKQVRYKAGTVLFRQGDALKGVYLLVNGTAHLTAGEGSAALRRVCGPGSLLGLPATMRNRPYSLSAECVDDCQCVHIAPKVFTVFLASSPAFCMEILQVLAEEIVDLRGKVPANPRKKAVPVH
jgi:CRP-like cAMP-binding protein